MDERLGFRRVLVFDGTGAPSVETDVVVEGDRIVAVGPGAAEGVADAIGGEGLALSPGFIDVHTHDDIAVMDDPDHGCKTLQGVTSVVVGNCGMSAAPASDDPLGFSRHPRLADYLGAVALAGPAVNVGSLVGHGTIRAAVMGLRTDRAPDVREREAMIEHVAAAMEDGALGFSSGLAYERGRYAAHDELVDFAEVVEAAGGIYTTHMRNESQDLVESIEESIAVSEATGVPLQISHLKASGRAHWGSVREALGRVVSTSWPTSTPTRGVALCSSRSSMPGRSTARLRSPMSSRRTCWSRPHRPTRTGKERTSRRSPRKKGSAVVRWPIASSRQRAETASS